MIETNLGIKTEPSGRKGLIARLRTLDFSIVLLIAVAILAYLPYVGQLGFYYNDWHLLGGQVANLNPVQVFMIDRPFLGLIYTITHALLGDNPLLWHLFSFVVRLSSGLGFLWLLHLIWPSHRVAITSMALLFMVYPGFLQQPMALTFSNHFLAYSAAIFSLVFTLLLLRTDKASNRFFYTVLAIGMTGFYLVTYEYMIGLEAVRLVLIFYYEWPRLPARWMAKVITVARRWVVFLIPLGLFMVWRVVLFGGSKESTSISILANRYLNDPFGMISRFFVETVKDYIEIVFLGWGIPLYQYSAKAAYQNVLIAFGIAFLAVLITFFWFRNNRLENITEDQALQPRVRNISDAVWLGALFVLFAVIPVVFSNRQVLFDSNFDRYTMHATIGVALLVGGAIFTFLKPINRKWIILFLVFISVTLHVLNGEHFRTFWNVQKSLWWQMTWRIPQLADDSFQMILLPDRYRFQGDTEIWVPTNLVYNDEQGVLRSSAEVLNRDTAILLASGYSTYRNWRGAGFTQNYDQTLVTSVPALSSCAHMLDGRQMELSDIEDPVVRLAAPHSKVELIDPNPDLKQLPEGIFGPEPEHGWCYYYQTASLLRQRGDWESLAELGNQVLNLGLKPFDRVEWMPFYEGFLNVGQTERADLVLDEIRQNVNLSRSLCLSLKSSPGSYSSPQIYQKMVTEICGQY